MEQAVVVRAVDVGYGHVKFTDSYDAEGTLCVDSFPSQSPIAKGDPLSARVLKRRDTFIVPVGKRFYEVGKEVADALHGHQESAVLDTKFALSDAYHARLLGALNYMAPNLPGKTLDCLVLGLPLTTFKNLHEKVAQRYSGEQVLNTKGDTLFIRHCEVFPQPLGSYAAFLGTKEFTEVPRALVIDPGYNTIDWFVCKGMVVSDQRSEATHRGMSAVMKDIAERIIKELSIDAGTAEVIRLVDAALTNGKPLKLCGQLVNLPEFMPAGDSVIEEAAQAVKNSVASGADIDEIVMTGGGACLYAPAVQKFFSQPLTILPDSSFANVRGFQALGENVARSQRRAMGNVKA
ncbi:MAG: PRTRC system protein D [Sulfuritalea sp.]|nr:PRTRC system protein D [Sulfuritalea sp.]